MSSSIITSVLPMFIASCPLKIHIFRILTLSKFVKMVVNDPIMHTLFLGVMKNTLEAILTVTITYMPMNTRS